MTEPLFPVKPILGASMNRVYTIEPYKHEGTWVFDDPRVGLEREPFVAGVTEMMDRLTASIPDAANGFRLLFAAQPFDGYENRLTWLRADPVEGNWYRAEDQGDEGWLCPALLCYFPVAPHAVYLRAEPRDRP
jgi:hypothetical protein